MTTLGRKLLGKFSLTLVFVSFSVFFSLILEIICILHVDIGGHTFDCWIFVLHLRSFFFLFYFVHFDCIIGCLIFDLICYLVIFEVLFNLILISFGYFTFFEAYWSNHDIRLSWIWNPYFSIIFSFGDFVFSFYFDSFWKFYDWF